MAPELSVHIRLILFGKLGPLVLALQLVNVFKDLIPLGLGLAVGAQFFGTTPGHMAGTAIFPEKEFSFAGITVLLGQTQTQGSEEHNKNNE